MSKNKQNGKKYANSTNNDQADCSKQNEEILRLTHELESARKETQALMDACALLTATLELPKLLEAILSQSAILTEAEASSLALIDTKTEELCFEVVTGDKKDILKEIRLPKGTGIIGWVSLNGAPLLIKDVNKDERFYQKVDEKSQFKTSSILCVPLKTKDGTIGALEVLNKLNGQEFDLNDQRLLTALANQAAMAIENAKLYQNVLEEKNKIVSIVNSMSDGVLVTDDHFNIVLSNPAADKAFGNSCESIANSEKLKIILSELSQLNDDASFDLVLMKPENLILSNKMAVLRNQQNEANGAIISMRNITDLKKRENIKAQFTSTMNYHIADEIQTLRENLKSSEIIVTPQVKSLVDFVEEKISKLIQFSEIESGPLRLDRSLVKVNSVVGMAYSAIIDQMRAKDVNFYIECDEHTGNLEIEVDAERIKTAILLLLKNSLKFTSFSGNVYIKVTDMTDNIEIQVIDNGIGMQADLIEKLLDKKQQLNNFFNNTSEASLGLAYVQHVLEAHGGRIKIQSNVAEGTQITLKIPKYIH
ncbi:MAG: ATP-binding protein [Candidatus Wallbacteria bacterium]